MNLLRSGPADAARTVVLAHGAGAPMDSPFMNTIATGLAERGLAVVRFEFPYMQRRRQTSTKRPPDRTPKLLAHYAAVIASLGDPARLVIGGKSMGGRVASMIADESGVAGLLCLGYPFHPPGRPSALRTAHLAALTTPALILQGERDPMGSRREVEGYALSETITVRWLPDGGHSLRPRKRSGYTEEGNLRAAVDAASVFIASLP